MTSSGIDNPEMSALLSKQLEAAKAELTTAVAAAVPLTEDKYTEHKLAFQKYNTWAKASLEARTIELDKEIARLQSERQLVVDEQAHRRRFIKGLLLRYCPSTRRFIELKN